jgi:hypothetical protein
MKILLDECVPRKSNTHSQAKNAEPTVPENHPDQDDPTELRFGYFGYAARRMR